MKIKLIDFGLEKDHYPVVDLINYQNTDLLACL